MTVSMHELFCDWGRATIVASDTRLWLTSADLVVFCGLLWQFTNACHFRCLPIQNARNACRQQRHGKCIRMVVRYYCQINYSCECRITIVKQGWKYSKLTEFDTINLPLVNSIIFQ